MKSETHTPAPVPSAATSVCKHCNRELPLEAFYVRKSGSAPESYCKECRRTMNRGRYSSRKRATVIGQTERPSYPVITQMKDPVARIRMIMNALEVVRRNIECKQAKLREAEELE